MKILPVNTKNSCNFLLSQLTLLLLISSQLTSSLATSSWDQWWAYDGISGPDYWGIINPKWSHCSKGRKQSPIDINPDSLLFDPGLEPIQMNKIKDTIHGNLINTGRGLQLSVIGNSSVTITSGPLSYQYSINHMILHYGTEVDRGSEHKINGIAFPGELQLYFYNSQLYHNWTQAAQESNGLAVIAVLIHIAATPEEESTAIALNSIVKSIEHIKLEGTSHKLESVDIHKLLPTLEHYITYEGSLTEPPCHETVQWIVLNKPLYATNNQLSLIRNSLIIDGYGDNYRPIQSTNYRCVRTNILREFNTTLDEITSQSMKGNHEFNKKRLCGNKGYVTYKANIKRDLDDGNSVGN